MDRVFAVRAARLGKRFRIDDRQQRIVRKGPFLVGGNSQCLVVDPVDRLARVVEGFSREDVSSRRSPLEALWCVRAAVAGRCDHFDLLDRLDQITEVIVQSEPEERVLYEA